MLARVKASPTFRSRREKCGRGERLRRLRTRRAAMLGRAVAIAVALFLLRTALGPPSADYVQVALPRLIDILKRWMTPRQ